MSSKPPDLATITTAVQTALAGKEEIIAVYLFGSAARQQAHRQSDIDLAVLFTAATTAELRFQQAIELGGRLETKVGRPLDLVVLNSAPVFLQARVLQTGRLLFERDRTERCLFQMRTMGRYYDLKPYLEYHRTQAIRRIRQEGLGHGYRGHRDALAEARKLRQTSAPATGGAAG
jgi:predicted nucleotidyltransferase